MKNRDDAPVTFGELRKAVALIIKYVHAESAFLAEGGDLEANRIAWLNAAGELETEYRLSELLNGGG